LGIDALTLFLEDDAQLMELFLCEGDGDSAIKSCAAVVLAKAMTRGWIFPGERAMTTRSMRGPMRAVRGVP